MELIRVQDVYRLGSKWYFRACPELPNRKYKYRAYSLNSLDDVLNDNLTARERFHEQTVKRSVRCFLLSELDCHYRFVCVHLAQYIRKMEKGNSVLIQEVFKIIANRESVTADIPTSATEAVTSTNHEPDDSHQLIKFDNELLPVGLIKCDDSLDKI